MPMIRVEIIKTIDEKKCKEQRKKNKQRQKGVSGTEATVKW